MATEFRAIRKKRASSNDVPSSNPAPEGDHRKRRRNRTTQSCLNCHTSKRMCDRKRPCGRCTQLGLTGLCVYEVDDPSQRNDVQDESSRLRQRVAELEGVIRELKNKPHPRWAKSGSSPGEEFDKSHELTRSRAASEDSGVSHPSASSSSCSNDESPDKKTQSLLDEALLPCSFSPPSRGDSAPLSTLSYSPYLDIHSPPSVPSTGIVTPSEEHSQIKVAVAGEQQLSTDIDLASLFMSYPGLLACDDGLGNTDHGPYANQYMDTSTKYHYGQFLGGHCGCLNEGASYNVVLELSLRLRKAADILSHSVSHRYNSGCALNQRIAELDTFVTTALGNMTTSPNDFGPTQLRSRANTAPSGPVPPGLSPSNCIPSIRPPNTTISPPSIRGLRPWNAVSCSPDPTGPCEESFMTWEPLRRC